MSHVNSTHPADRLVHAFVRNTTGVIELNRPKALNCLNQEMVDVIAQAFDAWRDDASVHRVVVYSLTDRAFCAGGDIRDLRTAMLEGREDVADRYLVDEYALNDEISRYPKPVISVIDGIIMGGGMGLAIHGSHRVVTETVTAAMPETAIGFCADVGATWMLARTGSSRCAPSQALANFLCMTGYRMGAADMMYTGVATDHVPAADKQAFIDMVIAESIDDALECFAAPYPDPSPLESYASAIEQVFSFDTFAQISSALDACADETFVRLVRELFAAGNPTSIVATAELVAANMTVPSLRHALDNEYALGAQLRREPNFVEGVRAVVVDKDRQPQFTPASCGDVDATFYRTLLSHRHQ